VYFGDSEHLDLVADGVLGLGFTQQQLLGAAKFYEDSDVVFSARSAA
jgi:hypothetical protein